jgi:ComF family protein
MKSASGLRPLPRHLQAVAADVFAVLVPPLCVACGRPLACGDRWLCNGCRARLWTGLRRRVRWLDLGDGITMQVRYLLDYGPFVSRIVGALKYGDKPGLASLLAACMRTSLDGCLPGDTILVPVPLSAPRRRERTYNQSRLLAAEVSRLTGCPVRPDILFRKRATRAQTGLDRGRRLVNVAGAFAVGRAVGPAASILLIDDVITTGSTLRECARELAAHRMERVSACVLASSVQ